MKKYLYTLMIVVVVYFDGNAQATNVVIENQTITGTFSVEATNSITIKPTTLIQAGSSFSAQIINGLEARPEFPAYAPITLSNENYVFTRSFQDAMSSFSSGTADEDDVIENIVYYDGLGRPMQQIAVKSSVNYEDMVTHVGYDGYGRQDKEWLPYEETTGSLGAYRGDVSANAQSFYKNKYPTDFPNLTGTNVNAYSQKEFEPSPLNRILLQGAPGESWKVGEDHEIGFGYATNSADEVMNFKVDVTLSSNTYTPTLIENGFYGQGILYKNITKDENHDGSASKLHTTEEFVDKQGRVVLKRTYAPFDLTGDGDTLDAGEAEVKHDTYYIYDDFGNLTYVIPPKASTTTTTTTPYLYSQSIYFSDFVFSEQGNPVQGGGSLTIKIENSTLKVIFSASFQEGIIDVSKTYPINAISPVPNMTVGYLDVAGSTNRYTIYVENDELKFLDNIPTAPAFTSFSQTLTAALNSSIFGDTVVEEMDLSATNKENLWYQYVYDHRNRLVEKKIPGKGWEYIVYNKLDQPIMVQDAIQDVANEWLFTQYDAFGRVAYTGIDTGNTSTRSTLQTSANSTANQYVSRTTSANSYAGTTVYYTKNAYPTSFDQVYTINYYDSYVDTDGLAVPTMVLGQPTSSATQGLPTVNKVRVLGTNDWITTVTGYDAKGRTIYLATKNNYLNTTDVVETELDFGGKILQVKTTHQRTGDSDIVTVDFFTYDHEGRLVSQQQSIDEGSYTTLMENTYDNIGQLASKDVGEGLQNVDYTYNVRGWLKQINNPSSLGSDLFAFGINYNTQDHGGATLFNGNIAETEWKTANDNTLRWYKYGYDPLNRITSATASSANYHLNSVSYDKNGNIMTLSRKGHTNSGATTFGTMDNLIYTYDSGNKLLKVLDNGNDTYGFKDGVDQTTEYTYDANGNMTSDANKGITGITYNHLNMPTAITTAQGTISYIYDAAGTKLQKTVGGSVTQYAGNYIYQDGNLEFFTHPEGYAYPNGNGGYDYVYQYKDHLGNIRLSYVDNSGTLEIVEENNYYPFGLKHKGYNEVVSSFGNSVAQKWKFGGKEYQEEFDLNWYDVTARNYDPALGRWMNIDPLAEQMRRHSPYNYAFDNPVFFIDPDGMAPFENDGIYVDTDGNKVGEDSKGASDGKVYVVDGSSKRQVQKATDQGKTIERNEIEESFELPSNSVKKEHATMVAKAKSDDTKEFSSTNIEQKDGTTYNHNVEGPEYVPGENAHVDPLSNLPSDKKGIVKVVAHTHNVDPSKNDTEETTYSAGNKPSPNDYNIAASSPYAINVVINTRKDQVYVIKANSKRIKRGKTKIVNKRFVKLKSSTYFKKTYN
ncbi:DUF6443 domain-containing protein [Flagellimonas lutimaris]|uniref:DUF6443 domain-containing protein n=1 Tax=Flagellimonas lutimaris TaxID=475082 RepID=UPI003F5CE756